MLSRIECVMRIVRINKSNSYVSSCSLMLLWICFNFGKVSEIKILVQARHPLLSKYLLPLNKLDGENCEEWYVEVTYIIFVELSW